MRTEFAPRLAEIARSNVNAAYKKPLTSAPEEARRSGDTVELSTQARAMNGSAVMEQKLEQEIRDKVMSLKQSFSQGTLGVDSAMADKVAERLLAVI
jgi:anti-sigma28 factor (negative regulator of flagellin synthesis)